MELVIQTWFICDNNDDLIISGPLFCLHPTHGVKRPGGIAAPCTFTVVDLLWARIPSAVVA